MKRYKNILTMTLLTCAIIISAISSIMVMSYYNANECNREILRSEIDSLRRVPSYDKQSRELQEQKIIRLMEFYVKDVK